MKKLLTLVLALALSTGLFAGCDGGGDNDNNQTNGNETTGDRKVFAMVAKGVSNP